MSCFLLTFCLTILLCSEAQSQTLAKIEGVLPEEIKIAGFELSSAQDVQIEGVGFRPRGRRGVAFTNAWILDAQSRDVVWTVRDAKIERKGRRLAVFSDSPRFDAGKYEVYFSSFPFHHQKLEPGFFERLFDGIFEEDDEDVYHGYKKEWEHFGIVVSGKGKSYGGEDLDEIRKPFLRSAFVSLTHLGADDYQRQGFELTRPLDIEIYALGEARRDGTFDYGWIINAETRKKIWQLTLRDSEPAGGSKKNRLVRKTLHLGKGNYAAFFVTDDSHSPDGWNSAPPHDPDFWGLTLRVANPSLLKYVERNVYDEHDEGKLIVKLTRLHDDEFVSKCVRSNRNMVVRIYALGEGKRREMYDYGWIIDSDTHAKIWAMNYDNTEHAGGAAKNRLFDGMLNLKKGNYIVCYVTDDSHSYADWTDAPPYDRENWGITIWEENENNKPGDFVVYDANQEEGVLAQIVKVFDHARERQSLKINRGRKVRVYAIGEGDSGEMYDYGWIENATTRRVIWEMTYRRTEPAGGSKKNRLIDEVIWLDEGEYVVRFQTDDSHSFERWNSPPPDDPLHWGITVYDTAR